MNKKLFTGLIVLMSISIVGIITVQLIWMNNAIKVKNELFSRGVNEALQQTVNRLEDINNLGIIHDMSFSSSDLWVHEFEKDSDLDEAIELRFLSDPGDEDEDSLLRKQQKAIFKSHRPVKIIRERHPNKKGNSTIEIKVDSDTSKDGELHSFSYRIDTKVDNQANRIFLGNNQLNAEQIIVLKADTIETSIDSLYSRGIVRIDSFLQQLDTIDIVRPDISKRARHKAVELKNLANEVVTEIYQWDIKDIDEDLLKKVLSEELRAKNIPIDFEFGIARDSIFDFPVEVEDSTKVANSVFQAALYPNDIFSKNLKVAVFFPEQDNFIYRSLNWLLVVSFLFSTFILVTFALSIYYILRQKKVSEMKSDFINNMTHEFKTPIATISVATDSINNEKVIRNPERIRYFAGMIKKENTRMNRQVEDILTIARLDRRDFEFTWEAIDIHALINDAVQGIILQVEKRGGKIESILAAANPVISTDRMHCTNVIYNLLDNAIKYSTEAPDISIQTTNQTKGVLLSVEDNGIGMNKMVQGKIFERFYRQTSGNIHNVKGFGLGLSYVKAVLEANQGTIAIKSEPGKGSKFDVFLPFVKE